MKVLITLLMLLSPLLHAQTSSNNEPNDANGDLRYISDDLFIYMHAGPGREFRILGSVSAGTAVSMLQVDTEAGYVEIIDDRQRTGWVPIKFVSRNPSIRVELSDTQALLAERESSIRELSNELAAIDTNLAESKQNKVLLNRQVTKQLEEIAELKRRISDKDRSDKMQWFTRGAMLGIAGVLVGYVLGRFGRSSKNSRNGF